MESPGRSLPLVPKFTEQAFQRIAALAPFPQPAVIPLRHPVILMHGFGLLAALRRHGHLHEEALNLRQHGVLAYAPNVAPYCTVPVRAEMWKERIEAVLEETGADRVNLIAHSMGGLDARYLISQMGMHEVVASLVTVSTPHRGSSIAAITLEQPERLRGWITDLCNWMGTLAIEEPSSDFHTAVTELVPEYVCETFNAAVPDHPDVRYFSYAGRAGRGTDVPLNPFLLVLNNLLYAREGVNDGFVSVESAKWGEFLGTIDADHAREVGIQVIPGGTFKSNAFYRSVAEVLSAEGF